MGDATELANAVASALEDERLRNDPTAQREAQKRTMNKRIRAAANVGRVPIPTADDGGSTGGLDQGARGTKAPPPDGNQAMNDLMRSQLGIIGGDE
jgi:hypothetical protein